MATLSRQVEGAAALGMAPVVAQALWSDADAAEALAGAGFEDPEAVDWDDPPQELLEAIDALPQQVQTRVATSLRAGGQQAPGDSTLGSLAGDLPQPDPTGQVGPGSSEQPVPQAPPEESGPTFEGHVFAEPPPTPDEAATRRPDGRLRQQFVSQGPEAELSPQALSAAQAEASSDISDYTGHTPSSQVLPYVRALHEWATAEGRSVEGLFRQRFYRQETLRLNRELQTRTTRTPEARAISAAEAHLRGWVQREGSLSPWESDTPLSFTDDELTRPTDKVTGLISELPEEGGTSGGEMTARRGSAFGFAPFKAMASREDLFETNTGAALAQNALADLGQSGDWDSEALDGLQDQTAAQFAQDQQAVFLRKDAPQFPDYPNGADQVLRQRAPGGDPNIARLSSFAASPQAVIDQLHRLPEPEVEKLQVELWKAGFFGQEIPTKGFPDGATVEAMTAALTEAAGFARAGEVVTVEDVIERRKERFEGRLGQLASGARGLSQQTVQVALEDPAALQELIEQQSIQTIGAANLDEAQVQSFIGAIHQAQRQQAASRVQRRNQALEQWQPETPWDEPPPELGEEGGVVESVNVSAAARAEDFVEAQRPAEAGATQFANTYGSFLDLIRGGSA